VIPYVVNGFVIGSIYGLVALGLVLVYKGTRTLNFAHGEMGMVAAFMVFSLWANRRWPYFAVVLLALLVSAAIGWLTDRLIMRRTREHSRLTVLVATFAVASIIQFVAIRVWGGDPKFVPSPIEGAGVQFGQVVLTPPRLLALVTSALIAFGLYAFFRFTRAGLIFRAVAVSPEAARFMGVDIDRVSSLTWMAGAALSGLAAILVAPLVSFHVFFMALLLIRALAAALIGGLTNFAGTFIAGLLLGVGESVIAKYVTAPGALEALLFAAMALTLVLRPRGLFAAEY
jgi:branched-chain amino acid transport system permease protein